VLAARRARRLSTRSPILLALLLAATCAPATPAGSPAGAGAEGGAAARPAGAATAAPAELAPARDEQPETDHLVVAAVIATAASLPLHVAMDAGYFQQHGLTVEPNILSASASVQALVAGSVQLYQGGSAAISAHLAGSDIIYVAAAVDRSSLVLYGEKGLTAFPDFRGRAIALTSPGAFGEIALHQTAREYGMVSGQDFELRYNTNSETALYTFLSGATAGAIVSPPQTVRAAEQGYPVIVDYRQRGLKIVGPGMAVTRGFADSHPNTVKAFLKGYLDGLRRSLDDRDYAVSVAAKLTRVEDASFLLQDYEEGRRTWNLDMTVDRAAIEVVLENSPLPNARDANPDDFYDNRLIAEVNATYAAGLFPEVFAAR
jgi:ABC-type nitrate/sulfonate/bicarbonate transport system substrate-binding protein